MFIDNHIKSLHLQYYKKKKNDTLTRDINRLQQNKLTNYYRAKRNCKKVQRGNEIIRR